MSPNETGTRWGPLFSDLMRSRSLARLCHLVTADAASADPDPAGRSVHHGADGLEVGIPTPSHPVVGVTNVVPGDGAFAAYSTDTSHSCPLQLFAQAPKRRHYMAFVQESKPVEGRRRSTSFDPLRPSSTRFDRVTGGDR
jgi:hypothetical protein